MDSEVRKRVEGYAEWLGSPEGSAISPYENQPMGTKRTDLRQLLRTLDDRDAKLTEQAEVIAHWETVSGQKERELVILLDRAEEAERKLAEARAVIAELVEHTDNMEAQNQDYHGLPDGTPGPIRSEPLRRASTIIADGDGT